MERNLDWSRRDLLKSAATGAVALGLGAAAVDSMDRYVVGASSGAAATAAMSLSDVRHNRIDLGEYGTLVSGVYSAGVRQSMRSRDDVAFVQPDRPLSPPPDPTGRGYRAPSGGPAADGSADGGTMPWGIDRVDADVAHEEGATGEGAHVGIVDGGIDDGHPDLRDNLADTDDDANHRAWEECQGDDCTHPWSDDGDHGTHVSGTVAAADGDDGVVGVATGATLHALKVCDQAGRCRTSSIADAIRHAADQGWDVLNISLGSPSESPALEAAGKYAADAGVLLVASAGNAGPCDDCVGYPARYDEYVAVGATTIDDELAEFSSTGPDVDLAAPGQDVCSSVVGGHGVFDGTSMASPHVAGAAAQLVADGYTSEEARERLLETAEDVGLGDDESGHGFVDVAAALDMDSDDDGTGDGTGCPT